MWRAKTNEGGDANLKLLAEIGAAADASTRSSSAVDELCRLHAAPAHGAQRTRNAGASSTRCVRAVTGREQRELDELRAAKARDLEQAAGATTLERWDVAFYSERVRRERYSVDQEAFRPYFPPQESLRVRDARGREACSACSYARVPDVKLWHPDVQAYAVQRRAHRQAAGGAVRRPVPARRQVQPRRGLELPQRLDCA